MLDYLRQRSQSAIIVFFVAIICAVFIINFGPQSQGCGSRGTVWLARVYGTTITQADFRWVERLVRGRYRLPRDYAESRQFVDDVVNGLIESELLARAGTRAGLAVGDQDVHEAFRRRDQVFFSWPVQSVLPLRGPILHGFRDEEGEVDTEELRDYVMHGLQMSERAFTDSQKREILAERMRELVEQNTVISDDELWAEYARYADRVNLQYARIYPPFFREALHPTAEEVDAFARQHASEVEERYEADRFRYRNVRKQLRILDITVGFDEDASDEVKAARRAHAEAILGLAKAEGADFGLLARCFSDDERTAAKSGDLGYLRQGMSRFGSDFDDAVFELAPGTLSDVIPTKRAFHIVRVLDSREGDVDLVAATPEIAERLLRQERGDARAHEVAESLLARAREGAEFDESLVASLPELQPDTCPTLPGEEAPEGAEEPPPRRNPLAPVVRETGFFNRSGFGVPGIGESSELMTAAFDLTDEHPVPDEVLQIRDDLFVVRLAEDGRQQPTREEFQEERPAYERRLLGRARQEALRIYVSGLRRAADSDGGIVMNDDAMRALGGPPEGEEGEGEEAEGGEGGEGSEGSEGGEGRSGGSGRRAPADEGGEGSGE